MSEQRIPVRGDVYESMGCVATVKRVSKEPKPPKFPDGWADLWVYQPSSGAGWVKRQPLPFADSFTFVRSVGDS